MARYSVTLSSKMEAAVDAWRAAQVDEPLFSAALRRLIGLGLTVGGVLVVPCDRRGVEAAPVSVAPDVPGPAREGDGIIAACEAGERCRMCGGMIVAEGDPGIFLCARHHEEWRKVVRESLRAV